MTAVLAQGAQTAEEVSSQDSHAIQLKPTDLLGLQHTPRLSGSVHSPLKVNGFEGILATYFDQTLPSC